MRKKVYKVVSKGIILLVGEVVDEVVVPSGRIAIVDLLNLVTGDLEILSKEDFVDSVFQFIPEDDSCPIDLCATKRGNNYWKVFPKGDDARAIIISKRIFEKLFIIKPDPDDFEVVITGADTNHHLPKV